MISGFTQILAAVYLAAILFQGNGGAFWNLVKTDMVDKPNSPGFLRWSIALVVLYALTQNKFLGPIGKPLFVIALMGIGFYIVGDKKVFENVKAAYALLGKGADQKLAMTSLTGRAANDIGKAFSTPLTFGSALK